MMRFLAPIGDQKVCSRPRLGDVTYMNKWIPYTYILWVAPTNNILGHLAPQNQQTMYKQSEK